jgi:hypothetical protein
MNFHVHLPPVTTSDCTSRIGSRFVGCWPGSCHYLSLYTVTTALQIQGTIPIDVHIKPQQRHLHSVANSTCMKKFDHHLESTIDLQVKRIRHHCYSWHCQIRPEGPCMPAKNYWVSNAIKACFHISTLRLVRCAPLSFTVEPLNSHSSADLCSTVTMVAE